MPEVGGPQASGAGSSGGAIARGSMARVGGATVVTSHTYRVGNVDAAIAARLGALKLDASGHSFSACAKTADAGH